MANNQIKVTAVSYLNTKPLLYGILKSPIAGQIDLELDIPSVCAAKLKDGRADLGLVPVAIIPELRQPWIISDYCIGAEGSVRTVCIYADRPIEQLDTIILDHHSRTSVQLTKYLLANHWRQNPVLVNGYEGYEQELGGKTGGLVIGDRAIEIENRFPFSYDLGEAWTQHTGLPFVFAAWVSTKPLPDDFILAFNQALQTGIAEIPQLMYLLPSPMPQFDLQTYFTNYISYELNDAKKKALQHFLNWLQPGLTLQYHNYPEAAL